MTQARFELNDYSIKVLDVIKGKYGLKNRNEALTKFIELFGEEFVKPAVNKVKESTAKYGKVETETIALTKKVKDRLDSITYKSETYSEVLDKILNESQSANAVERNLISTLRRGDFEDFDAIKW